MSSIESLKINVDKIISMLFSSNAKMIKKVPGELLEKYKVLYKEMLKDLGKNLPVHPNYLGDNQLARTIYKEKYFLKDANGELIETFPEMTFARLSSFIAATEGDLEVARSLARKFYDILYKGYFLPGGRVIAGAGDLFRLKTLGNCFVIKIEDDNIESIYKAAYESARTYSYGGGVGIDISTLRPRNAVVHNASNKSTGSVSFMELFSLTTGIIGQEGRRGALMIMIDVKHPDVFDFIQVKSTPNWVTRMIRQQLEAKNMFTREELDVIQKIVVENTQVRFANISVKFTDEFMNAVEEVNKYPDKYLIYKKLTPPIYSSPHDPEKNHYSQGMPAKKLDEYDLLGVFDDFESVNEFLVKMNATPIGYDEFMDINKRDLFGDFVVKTGDEYLAIRKSGDYMLYWESPEAGVMKKLINARELWNLFVASNYKSAEPGLVFWDRMTRYSNSNYVGAPIIATNPCAEVPLEDGGACNLGSINLSRMVDNGYTSAATINWDRIKEVTRLAVRFLDNVVTWNEYLNPLQKQKDASVNTRRIGLGVMGIADMLNQLGIAYDSDEGIMIIDKIMKIIANTAYQESARLSAEKGPCKLFDWEKLKESPYITEALTSETRSLIKENGLRNIAIMSIAPTGTISNIVVSFELNGKHYIGVSGGVEPIFALFYTRRSESLSSKYFTVFHSTVQAYIDLKGLNDKVQGISTEEELKKILPEHFFKTAHNISYKNRVKIQGVIQKYIDHSISSTINLPADIHPEVISQIYLEAWKMGLKGVTIYRDGSRNPILSVEGKKTKFEKLAFKTYKIVLANGKEIELKGDDVIILPNHKISTIYHEFFANKRNNNELN